MIEPCIESYCQDCDNFDPVKFRTGLYDINDREAVYVECRYRARCKSMYRHLKTEFKKEHNND